MDRLKLLGEYTVGELVDELKRRKDELDGALASIPGPSGNAPKNTRMSQAKAAYWKAWHSYKGQHPNATVAEWRKAKKRGKY